MEIADVGRPSRKRAVDFHLTVERVMHDEIVGHTDSMWFHGMALAIVIVSDGWFVEVSHAPLLPVWT